MRRKCDSWLVKGCKAEKMVAEISQEELRWLTLTYNISLLLNSNACVLHDELRAKGFTVRAGEMGENITTRGVDLLRLPVGAWLHLGTSVIEITGLRNPCTQLNGIQKGLMAAVMDKDVQGNLIRKAGVMGVVLVGGEVRPSDPIYVELPPEPHRPLDRV